MSSRLPSLNWLRVFAAAARSQSFARAAAELNLSPPAVSQQIKALEQQLGVTLFLRHAHSVELTDMGRAYLPAVQFALTGLEQATEGLFGQMPQQSVHVHAVLVFAQSILAPAYPKFQDAFPETTLVLTTGNAPRDFENRFVDFRIVFGDPAQFGVHGEAILDEWLTPVAPRHIAQDVRDIQDLSGQTLIEVATHSFGWAQVFKELGQPFVPKRVIYADSTPMAFALSQAGAGVALARSPASDHLQNVHTLEHCLPQVRVQSGQKYHLLFEDKRGLRASAKKFRNWLLDHLKSEISFQA